MNNNFNCRGDKLGYLICNECEGYYELESGETPENFSNECECGGKLRYADNLPKTEEKQQPRMKPISEYEKTDNINPNTSYQQQEIYREKSPILAVILSFFIPGLGQFYNGHFEKGVILLVVGVISALLIVFLIGIALYLVVWAFAIFDAFDSADRMNKGKPVRIKLQDYL